MSAESILAAYPHCKMAVAYCELVIGGESDDGVNGFTILRRENATLDEAMHCIRASLREDDDVTPQIPALTRVLAQAEMDHPTFRHYLAAKLGLL